MKRPSLAAIELMLVAGRAWASTTLQFVPSAATLMAGVAAGDGAGEVVGVGVDMGTGGGVGTPGGNGVGSDGMGRGLPGRTVIVTLAWSSISP